MPAHVLAWDGGAHQADTAAILSMRVQTRSKCKEAEYNQYQHSNDYQIIH